VPGGRATPRSVAQSCAMLGRAKGGRSYRWLTSPRAGRAADALGVSGGALRLWLSHGLPTPAFFGRSMRLPPRLSLAAGSVLARHVGARSGTAVQQSFGSGQRATARGTACEHAGGAPARRAHRFPARSDPVPSLGGSGIAALPEAAIILEG